MAARPANGEGRTPGEESEQEGELVEVSYGPWQRENPAR